MALGETLKNARVQKGLSVSDVAESTHMMVQVVEELEREDFRRIAAPIYGRGFVRLYAELLELDSEPLIRDFMELYAGARTPAVRTKRIESPAESFSESATLASGGVMAPVQPQRQPVQPKPSVRPLSMPQTSSGVEEAPVQPVARLESAVPAAPVETPVPVVHVEEPADRMAEVSVSETLPPTAESVVPEADDQAGLVVEPEAAFAESDEPDLFRPQPLRRKPVSEEDVLEESKSEDGITRRGSRKTKQPVFKIGGRMESELAPEAHDEAAHERRLARIKKFVDGISKLKSGMESRLPRTLPHKKLVALGSASLVLVVCMAVGIRMLFKMTGSTVKESPRMQIKVMALPPDLYVD